jgi:hypothetical protein
MSLSFTGLLEFFMRQFYPSPIVTASMTIHSVTAQVSEFPVRT